MKDIKLIVGLLVVCAVMMGGIIWYLESQKADTLADLLGGTAQLPAPLSVDELDVMQPGITNEENPIVVFDTTLGTIKIELFKDTMPITAGNFEKLVSEDFYNGIKFHRVIDGFMIQAGDPQTKDPQTPKELYGTGGPGYAIADEHVEGVYLTNVRGTISMANSGPNSGGSQFFINTEDNTALDFNRPPSTSKHPVFGRVIEGMDVVDAIAVVPRNDRDLPLTDIVILKAEIE